MIILRDLKNINQHIYKILLAFSITNKNKNDVEILDLDFDIFINFICVFDNWDEALCNVSDNAACLCRNTISWFGPFDGKHFAIVIVVINAAV